MGPCERGGNRRHGKLFYHAHIRKTFALNIEIMETADQ
jgi:hypothetical protein